eukprot:TRINITY_DN110459_c0_g1_i1.p1 TRINITY_DN110459_c0_g1~~TRINITY_DN110459_c0_g1_i1.p1  ORF type:complete len:417 (-),score=56.68 TRINITY_DN110459_c0_g1_i1:67-1317(-)
MAPLDVGRVRSTATRCGLQEVQFSTSSRVIAFKTWDGMRINVYYTTGTVGTCLEHPRQGKTQLFRRNVDYNMLENIFRNPRIHTDLGYHEVKHFATRASAIAENRSRSPRRDSGTSPSDESEWGLQDEESAARDQVMRLKAEKESIEKEIAAAQVIVDGFERAREEERRRKEEEIRIKKKEEERKVEEERRRQEEEAKQTLERQKEAQRKERGAGAIWSLADSNHVEKGFNKYCTCVAVGGIATLLISEGGGYSYTSGLPTYLHNKLHTRPRNAPAPIYVALGSHDRYYVEFSNGKSEWVGPDAFSECMNDTKRGVKSIAFGEDYETFFVVFQDGWWQCGGAIPSGLLDKIRARDNSPDLTCVSLGPNGEWYLSARNGRAWWGGLSEDGYAAAGKHRDTITGMWFGDGRSYFIRYS